MEKKIMIEYEKNLMKKFDGMIEKIHTFHDGFSEESMQRMEYELLQVKDNRDIFSVFDEENLQLDNDVLDEFKRFSSRAIPSNDELSMLFSKIFNGDCGAKQYLVDAHQLLVALVAKEYFIDELEKELLIDIHKLDVTFEELMKIGNVGLEKAIDKFDYEKGFDFPTYAFGWICNAFSRSMATLFNIPVHAIDIVNRVYIYIKRTEIEFGREPTGEEIAEKLDMRIDTVQKILKIIQEVSAKRTEIVY